MEIWLNSIKVYKICANEVVDIKENTQMLMNFAVYFRKSKTLGKFSDLHYKLEEVFEVLKIFELIIHKKRIGHKQEMFNKNLYRCLEGYRIVNMVYLKLETMKCESFNMSNSSHAFLLEEFWNNMMPDKPRLNGLINNDWCDLGFQSKDPSTDFRGMGLLGLYHLVYFAKNRTQTARILLEEFSKPDRFFPFAIIGISISRFVMELLKEYRLHLDIIKSFGKLIGGNEFEFPGGPSNDMSCISFCTDVVHDMYCIVFEDFYLTWVVRNPKDVMSFSELFEEVKSTVRNRYPPL